MLERERRSTRREFLLGIATLLSLTGCEMKAGRSVTPEIPERPEPEKKKEETESPFPQEILSPQASEEKEEIWSFEEIKEHYPLVIENWSSFRIEGVYRQRLEEAMGEVKVNEGQFLGIIFEDTVGPYGEKTLGTTLVIFKIKEGGKEAEGFPGSVSIAQGIPFPELTDEEKLALGATISLRFLLTYASLFQPYLADGELTQEEFEEVQQGFGSLGPENIRQKIIKEVIEDREEKVIFIFSPPLVEA